MANWVPISGSALQFSKNAGGAAAADYYLKFYAAGTTTAISMATTSSGVTTLDKCKVDSNGWAVNGSNAVFIPHIDRDYKLVLYTNATDADADATGSAAWVIDNLSTESIDKTYTSVTALRDSTGNESFNVIEIESYYEITYPSTAGPKGGHRRHRTGGTNTSPTVGSPVAVSTIGTGTQAGYVWDGDGVEWFITIENHVSTLVMGVPNDGTDGNTQIQDAYLLSVSLDVDFKYDAGQYLHDTIFRQNNKAILSAGKAAVTVTGYPGKDIFSWDNSAARARITYGAGIEPMTLILDMSVDTRNTTYEDRCSFSGDNLGPCAISRGEADISIDKGIINNVVGGSRITVTGVNEGSTALSVIHNGTNVEQGFDVQSVDFGLMQPALGTKRITSISGNVITIDAGKLAAMRTRQGNPLAIGDSVGVIFSENDNPTETETPNTRYLISAITSTTITVTDTSGGPITFAGSPSPAWLINMGTNGLEEGTDGATFIAPKLTTNRNGFSLMTGDNTRFIGARHFYNQKLGDLLNGEYFGDNPSRTKGTNTDLGPMYCEGPFDNTFANKTVAKLQHDHCDLTGLWIANSTNATTISIDLDGNNCIADGGTYNGKLNINGNGNRLRGEPFSVSYITDNGAENSFIKIGEVSGATVGTSFQDELGGALNPEFDNTIGSLGGGDDKFLTLWTPDSYSVQGNTATLIKSPGDDFGSYLRLNSASTVIATRKIRGQAIKTGVNMVADVMLITAKVRTPNNVRNIHVGVQSIGGNTVPTQNSVPVASSTTAWTEIQIVANLAAATYDGELQINVISDVSDIIELNWIKIEAMRKAVNGNKVITRAVVAPSPDGTLYYLSPPNGGGAASWIAWPP